MWLTTQSIKTSFFPTIWEIFKELDSLIALAICTAQTFPIRQAQQSDTRQQVLLGLTALA